jgi:hypothetical protein
LNAAIYAKIGETVTRGCDEKASAAPPR